MPRVAQVLSATGMSTLAVLKSPARSGSTVSRICSGLQKATRHGDRDRRSWYQKPPNLRARSLLLGTQATWWMTEDKREQRAIRTRTSPTPIPAHAHLAHIRGSLRGWVKGLHLWPVSPEMLLCPVTHPLVPAHSQEEPEVRQVDGERAVSWLSFCLHCWHSM